MLQPKFQGEPSCPRPERKLWTLGLLSAKISFLTGISVQIVRQSFRMSSLLSLITFEIQSPSTILLCPATSSIHLKTSRGTGRSQLGLSDQGETPYRTYKNSVVASR